MGRRQDQDTDPRSDLKNSAGHCFPSVIRFLLIVIATLGADLASKHWAFEHAAGTPVRLTRQNSDDPGIIPNHKPSTIVPGVLSLKLTANTGALFGLGRGSQIIFILVSVLAVGVIGRVFWRRPVGNVGPITCHWD